MALEQVRSVRAPINGAVLEWARRIGGFSREELAHVVGKQGRPEVISAWENGDEMPTARQLEDIATKLKRPIAVFFMPSAPQEPDPSTALKRTIAQQANGLSSEMRLAIRTSRYVRDRFTELLESTNSLRECSVPVVSLLAEPDEAAKELRKRFGVTVSQQTLWPNNSAYDQWVDMLMANGVLTQQFSSNLKEAWGFAITDGKMPLVAVNRKIYYEVARIFTLFHEVGHIALRESAVSVLDIGSQFGNDEAARTEQWCNRFSAAFLLPLSDDLVLKALDKVAERDDFDPQAIQRIATKFRVSKYVLFGRFKDAGGIDDVAFRRVRSEWWRMDEAREEDRLRREKEKNQLKSGGPVAWQLALADRGQRVASKVLDAFHAGVITEGDASDILGVKPNSFEKLERVVYKWGVE